MPYISPNNEYPRYIGDIQIDYPDYVEGAELPEGWREVIEVDRPVAGIDEKIIEEFPVEINGVMTQNWQVKQLTPEEIELRNAPITLAEKLKTLGLNDAELALVMGALRLQRGRPFGIPFPPINQ